jgi:hypothetical protein
MARALIRRAHAAASNVGTALRAFAHATMICNIKRL